MRILVVNKFLFNKGGSETYIFNLFEYLSKLGHEVEFFGMEDPNNIVSNSSGQSISKLDFKGNILNKALYPFKIIYSVEAKNKIGRVIRNFKPDIIHLNNFNYQITPSILYEIKKYSLPVVQTLHDPQLVCPYHRLYNYKKKGICEKCSDGKFINCVSEKCIDNSLLKSIIGAAESYIYRQTGIYNIIDFFITPSNFLKDKLLSMKVKLPIDKFVVLHNFANKRIVKNTKETKSYVLYFGRISVEKGIQTLIAACKKLPEIKFIFVGSGDIENELKDISNIEFLGFKTGNDLGKIISEALFSVCPSQWYENCPMSVLESQMYGTPVIGANIGGIPELIEDGKDGLLFKAGDVEDLKDKINYLYKNEALLKEFSNQCSQKVTQRFSIEVYKEQLMKIYYLAIKKHES